MRRRILNSMIAMIVGVGLLLGIPLSVVAWWWMSERADQDLTSRLKLISDQLILQEDESGAIAPGRLDTTAFEGLLPERGRLTLIYREAGTENQRSTILGERIDGPRIADSIELGTAGSLLLEVPQDGVRGDQVMAVGIVAALVAASVAATIAVAAATAGRLADPLTDLATRAAAMARGDFRSEWKNYGIDELDRVSGALGDANAEIALRLEREGEIVGDVSHQIRSRLTAIGLRLDELTLHDDPSVVTEAEAALDQVERLTRELGEMVAGSRGDQASSQAVEVADLITTLVGDMAKGFAAHDRALTTSVSGQATARIRPTRLREAVSVLLDNSLRHGAGDCRISVSDVSAGQLVRITVSDDGPGISDDEAGMIFRRGFSAGRGTGVGLSLARALVEADGGRLDLTTRRPPTFSIVVPAAADDSGTELRRGRVPHR